MRNNQSNQRKLADLFTAQLLLTSGIADQIPKGTDANGNRTKGTGKKERTYLVVVVVSVAGCNFVARCPGVCQVQRHTHTLEPNCQGIGWEGGVGISHSQTLSATPSSPCNPPVTPCPTTDRPRQ